MKHQFQVTGMRCSSCKAHIVKAVGAVPGVKQVDVNVLTGQMSVDSDGGAEMVQKIINAVSAAGYKAADSDAAPPAAKDSTPASGGIVESRFQVAGMRCATCQAHISKAVKAVAGVHDVDLNLVTGAMTVKHGNAPGMREKIINAVNAAGYKATGSDNDASAAKNGTASAPQKLPDESRILLKQTIWSAILLAPLMYFAMSGMHGWWKAYPVSNAVLQLLLTLPIAFVNRVYFINGTKRLMRFTPDMDSLIALGSGASILYSLVMLGEMLLGRMTGNETRVADTARNLYFETAGMILLLVTFGKFLEAKVKRRTTDAVARLIKLAPQTAFVVRNGKEIEIPADRLAVGDIVVIKPGASIPADGVLVSGSGTVDQSSVTGESVPAGKEPGDRVVSGTLNLNGSFRFQAERVGKDSTLARIIELVENASNSSAPVSRFADRVSAIFVPCVLLAAAAAGCFWLFYGKDVYFALTTAISVVVISCPCALGLATPVAIMVGTGVGAKSGILFKNAAALEELHNIKTVVLDKTGTVTEGRHQVVRIAVLDEFGKKTAGSPDETAFLRIAAALESRSEHPFAKAVVRYAEEHGIAYSDVNVENFTASPGMGVSGRIDDTQFLCGNARMMQRSGVPLDAVQDLVHELEAGGGSLLFAARADAKQLCAVLSLRDTIKPGSADAVRAMHELGLKTVLLTGDTENAAKAAADEIHIERVIAGILPDGKEACIRKIQEEGGHTAMVGDGINDAAALARANVGIAIGSGTDIALETADVVLLRSDLRDAVTAIRLSRAVMRNIRINLFWAFFYNVLGIPIAAGVLYIPFRWQMHPAIGTAAMAFSSLFVVTNALRLRKFK